MASREFSEANMTQDADVAKLSQDAKVLRSWLFGAAEAVGESATGRIASRNFNLVKNSLKNTANTAVEVAGKDAAKKVSSGISKKLITDLAKGIGVDMRSEGISEGITQGSQMLTDVAMGTKDYTLYDIGRGVSTLWLRVLLWAVFLVG